MDNQVLFINLMKNIYTSKLCIYWDPIGYGTNLELGSSIGLICPFFSNALDTLLQFCIFNAFG